MGIFSFFPFKLNTCVLSSRRLVHIVFCCCCCCCQLVVQKTMPALIYSLCIWSKQYLTPFFMLSKEKLYALSRKIISVIHYLNETCDTWAWGFHLISFGFIFAQQNISTYSISMHTHIHLANKWCIGQSIFGVLLPLALHFHRAMECSMNH